MQTGFRPLSGIIYFNNQKGLTQEGLAQVSVPSRGLSILIFEEITIESDAVIYSFRPLSGIIYFNFKRDRRKV